MRLSIPVIALLLLSQGVAPAQTVARGSPEEAQRMAEAAADHLRQAGPDQAFRDFENRNSPFFDRDLYVFVQDYNCTFFAHGLNPSLKGRNIWNLRNPNGRFACQDIVKVTRENGSGWTRYIFQDPLTDEMAWKTTYSIGVDNYIVMVGAYGGRAENEDIKAPE